MFTMYDFYKGMFIELGGEFVDTNHEDLQKLGAELGVEMQKLAVEGEGEDLYFFRGRSAAMRAPSPDNTPRCWRWPGSPLSAAACNLPASIPAATSLAT
jgi:hypothetical protein